MLPQVLCVNNHIISGTQVHEIRDHIRAEKTWHLRRGTSAWVNAPAMVEVLGILGASLAAAKPLAHCVLVMDCSPVHTTASVVRAAARAGVHLLFVPASMTHLMQPLDTHIFANLKNTMRAAHERFALRSGKGEVSNVDACKIVFDSVKSVLQEGQ